MKRKWTTALLLLLLMLGTTACGAKDDAGAAQETEAVTETETAETETQDKEAAEPETEAAEEGTEAGAETEEALEEQSFTVDITDVMQEEGEESITVIGNTATQEAYSGIVELHIPARLPEKAGITLEKGKTYIVTVKPMMTMSIPPQMSATQVREATEEEVEELEVIRSQVSNYVQCREAYESMELQEIIADANMNYALWTQEEIKEYMAFIQEKGYTEDSEMKSYVNVREKLDGSVAGW